MDIQTILELFLLATGGAFVQRTAGFGFGIFVMTLLPYLMPSYGEATTLSGLLAAVTSIYVVITKYKYLHWKKVIYILCVFVPVSFLAIQFVSLAADGILVILLGIILVITGLWFIFFAGKIHIKPTILTQTGLGSLSGLMGGLFAMQGPPAVLYFVETTESKEEYLVATQMYLVVGNIFMTCYRAYCGFLTPAVGYGWIIGIFGVALGNIIGAIIFRHISIHTLKFIIYLYMIISGIICIF